MPTTVEIPGIGEVDFPDSMDDNSIRSKAKELHQRQVLKSAPPIPDSVSVPGMEKLGALPGAGNAPQANLQEVPTPSNTEAAAMILRRGVDANLIAGRALDKSLDPYRRGYYKSGASLLRTVAPPKIAPTLTKPGATPLPERKPIIDVRGAADQLDAMGEAIPPSTGIAGKVQEGIAGMPAALAQYAVAARVGTPGFAALGYMQNKDKPLPEALSAAGKEAILGKTGVLSDQLTRAPRAAINALVGAAANNDSVENAVSSGLAAGALSAIPGGGKAIKEFRKPTPSLPKAEAGVTFHGDLGPVSSQWYDAPIPPPSAPGRDAFSVPQSSQSQIAKSIKEQMDNMRLERTIKAENPDAPPDVIKSLIAKEKERLQGVLNRLVPAVKEPPKGQQSLALEPEFALSSPDSTPIPKPGEIVPPHKNASTQYNLAGNKSANKLAAKIKTVQGTMDPNDLDVKGLEDDLHVTLRYGVEDNADSAVAALSTTPKARARVKGVTVFPTEDGDAVVLELDSKDLQANRHIADTIPGKANDYPDYRPHITVAYVKPGLGEKYRQALEPQFKGDYVELEDLVFSGRDRQQTKLRTPKVGEPGPVLNREQRRAAVEPPSKGTPEETARWEDARQQLLFGLGAKPGEIDVEDLIGEGYGSAASRTGPAPDLGPPMSPVSKPPSWNPPGTGMPTTDFLGTQTGYNLIKGLVNRIRGKAENSDTLLNLEEKGVDRFARLQDLERGKGLSPDESPYVGASQHAGVYGVLKSKTDDLESVIRPVRKYYDNMIAVMRAESILERAANATTKGKKYSPPKGKTLADIELERDNALNSIPQKDRAKVTKAIDDWRKWREWFLDHSVETGLISKEQRDLYRKEHTKYMSLSRVSDKAGKPERAARGAFSVSKQGAFKKQAEGGGSKELVDPLEKQLLDAHRIIDQGHRNQVATKFANLKDNPNFKGVVRRIKNGTQGGKDEGTFHILRNGKLETYATEKPLADALTRLDDAQVDFMTRWVANTNKAFRAGVTLNPFFMVGNVWRDIKTVNKNVPGLTPLHLVKGFALSLGRSTVFKKAYKEYLESYGSFSGYYSQQKALDYLQGNKGSEISKMRNAMLEGNFWRAAKTANPLARWKDLGETAELGTRLAAFSKAKSQGKSNYASGFVGRRSTVDFARRGSETKAMMLWLPFVNARLQGSWSTLDALSDPDRRTRALAAIGAMTIVPTVYTTVHNLYWYPEVWNSLSPQDKANYDFIIRGDETDEKGNYTNVIKLPKTEDGAFAQPIVSFIEYMQKEDPEAFKELINQTIAGDIGGAVDTASAKLTEQATPKKLAKIAAEVAKPTAIQSLSTFSPIPFAEGGEFSGRQALDTAIPPIFKAGYTGYSDQRFPELSPIVWDREVARASPHKQMNAETPQIYQKASEGLHALQKLIPATPQISGPVLREMGREAAGPLPDMLLGAASKQFINPNEENPFAKGAKSRFLTGYVDKNRGAAEEIEQVSREEVDERIAGRISARDLVNKAMAEKDETQTALVMMEGIHSALTTLQPREQEEFVSSLPKLFGKWNRSLEAAVLSGQNTEVKARYLANKILNGTATPEAAEQWDKAKILSPAVIERLREVMQQRIEERQNQINESESTNEANEATAPTTTPVPYRGGAGTGLY